MMRFYTMMRAQHVGALGLWLAGALLALPAFAADPAPKNAQAKPPAGSATQAAPKTKPNLMTRDELRACMDEQDRLQTVGEKVKQDQATLDRQRAEVQRMDEEIARKQAALDPADAAAAQALLDEVARRDAVVDGYNARLPALRELGSAYDTERQAWVQRCTTRDYDEMDEAAIRRDRRLAAGAKK